MAHNTAGNELPVSEELKLSLHPYMFVLKENEEELCGSDDAISYSLQMLQVGHLETIRSADQIHLFPLLGGTAPVN